MTSFSGIASAGAGLFRSFVNVMSKNDQFRVAATCAVAYGIFMALHVFPSSNRKEPFSQQEGVITALIGSLI